MARPSASIVSMTLVALVTTLFTLHRAVRSQSAPWRQEFESALAESRDKQQLLLICFNADLGGESGNSRMAYRVYRDTSFLEALEGVIPIIASPDEHFETDGVCKRFGAVACSHHMIAERRARRHVFGDRRDMIAPQHVLLFPDGGVAWHGLYEVSVRTLERELSVAKQALSKPREAQIAAQLDRLRSLVSGATSDPERYLVLSATVWNAPDDVFPKVLKLVPDIELVERLVRGLVAFGPDRAESRLLAIKNGCHERLQPTVDELLTQIRRQREAEAARTKEQDAQDNRESDAQADPVTKDTDEVEPAPLPKLGKPEPIRVLHFTDGVKRDVTGEDGKVTVLLFFLPTDEHIKTQVASWNRLAESMADKPVTVLALGASIVPVTELPLTRGLGLRFPAANYLYEESVAPYKITEFPRAVVIDMQRQVVFKGDAYKGLAPIVDRLLNSH